MRQKSLAGRGFARRRCRFVTVVASAFGVGCSAGDKVEVTEPARVQLSVTSTAVPSLEIKPINQTYRPGSVVKFQATTVSAAGVTSYPAVRWSATGGTIT